MRFTVHAAKANFFNPTKIIKGLDVATRNVLSRFGAFVRTRARQSIRKRKRTSAAGSPPSSHAGTLKNFLFFAYDRTRKSVVIGPAKTNQVFFGGDGQPVKDTVPEVLEYGGTIQILEWFRGGRWTRADLRSRRRIAEQNIPTRMRRVGIDARPFMGPALAAEKPGLPAMWRDSVR